MPLLPFPRTERPASSAPPFPPRGEPSTADAGGRPPAGNTSGLGHDAVTDLDDRPGEAVPGWMRAGPWAVAVLAAVLYAWGIGHAELHPYYSAAVRSMSASWRDFVFGAFDPAGSITMDKVPGAFWPQALSVRIFGLHPWALALPQVIEGVGTVVLLYHVVARWLGGSAGRIAGLVAALILTLTPITVAVNRHNLPDTLLTLALVAAAAAWQRAVRTGGLWALVACGLCVGAGFHAKMLQAWLLVPVFALTYLYAAPGSWLRRLLHVTVLGLTTVAASSVWVVMAALTPASSRPYVDGTTNNNPLALVFGYNALGRFGSSADGVGGVTDGSTGGTAHWDLLVNPTYASQISWLLPAALVALVAAVTLLWARQRRSRLMAGFVMWGLWLIVTALAFSASNKVHAYYTIALAPAVAALVAAGGVTFYPAYRDRRPYSWVIPAMTGPTVACAALLGGYYNEFVPTMALFVTVLGYAVVAAMVAHLRSVRPPRRLATALVWGSVALMLVSPAAWAVSVLDTRYSGPAGTPAAGWVGHRFRVTAHGVPHVVFNQPTGFTKTVLGYLTQQHRSEKYLVATEQDRIAEPLVRAADVEVLPIGGFSGQVPFPNADQLSALIGSGRLRYVLLSSATVAAPNPAQAALAWVKQRCHEVPRVAYGGKRTDPVLFDCQAAVRPAR